MVVLVKLCCIMEEEFLEIVAAPCEYNEVDTNRLREFGKKTTSGCLLSKDGKSALVIRYYKEMCETFTGEISFFLIFLVILNF